MPTYPITVTMESSVTPVSSPSADNSLTPMDITGVPVSVSVLSSSLTPTKSTFGLSFLSMKSKLTFTSSALVGHLSPSSTLTPMEHSTTLVRPTSLKSTHTQQLQPGSNESSSLAVIAVSAVSLLLNVILTHSHPHSMSTDGQNEEV